MDSGCRIVAQAKLLAEAGIAPKTFAPDMYLDWNAKNGYVHSISAVGETGSTGRGMLQYAAERGYTITRAATVTLTGKTAQQKIAVVWDYVQKGYCIILHCSDHQTYISRADSLLRGTPVISESGSSLHGGKLYSYTGVYKSQASGGYEANFVEAHIYSVTRKGSGTSGPTDSTTTVTATTTTYDSVTTNSAIVRGSVSSFVAEC